MTTVSTNHENDIRDEFMNITLVLLSFGLWCLILAGDILPGNLPNIIMFDAVIMIAVCGLCYFIKRRSFNFACFFLVFCIALIATQISIATGYGAALFLIPASLIIAIILLPARWMLLVMLADALFLVAFAPPVDLPLLLALATFNLTTVRLLRRYFINQRRISHNFQDYAADQMNEARESRAELVLMSKQLQEYQERLRVINRKLEIAFEQAEESRQAKARFAANVSHELRTPINLIVGFSEVIILAPELYDQPLPPGYHADIQAVYRNAMHLQNMINDVLDISQVEARQLAIVKEKGDLRHCVREAADMVADLIAKKGLDFQLDIPDTLPDLWFDPVRIRQILLNLLVNAIRFTSAGSITIAIDLDERDAVTSVIDTGIGLDKADIARVFDEFFRVTGDDALGETGSGLGLTLSRELIRLHGGAMSVSSPGVPGLGSTFSFSLPTTKNLVAQMPSTSAFAESAAPEKRIMIVDPDEAVTAFFTRYLKSQTVATCHDEDEALRALREFEPNVLLLAQGHRYQRLRQKIAQNYPALNLITLPMPSGRATIRQRGVTDYLVKPVSRAMLLKVLAQFGDDLRSIMIIDDNRDILRLFERTLHSLDADYTIRAADNGLTGLALMRAQPPDLLLLDVLMPAMDGFAVIETMQGDDNLASIPIVLISAKGASESITPEITGEITLHRHTGYSPIELVACVQALSDSLREQPDLNLARARRSLVAPP